MNKEATTQQKPDASLLNDARLAYSFVSSAGRRLTAVLEAASCAHYPTIGQIAIVGFVAWLLKRIMTM